MPQLFLTDDIVFSAICPEGKGQELFWDYAITERGQVRNGSVNGLGLRVTALGHKSYVHAYEFNGRRHRKVLGSTTVYSVASARLAVISRQQQIEAGKDPELGRIDTRRKHFTTVREGLDQYWESHLNTLSPKYCDTFATYVAAWLRRKPKAESRRGSNKRGYKDFGTMFAERPIAGIKPLQVEEYLKQFTSTYVFNNALQHVLAFYNWAIRMQIVDMRNPCSPIRRRKTVRRRRDYSTEQIQQIAGHIFCPVLEAVPDISNMVGLVKRDMALKVILVESANDQMVELCNYMGILFLTMARPSDLTTARFEHFDLEKLVWNKHNTKGIKLSVSDKQTPSGEAA